MALVGLASAMAAHLSDRDVGAWRDVSDGRGKISQSRWLLRLVDFLVASVHPPPHQQSPSHSVKQPSKLFEIYLPVSWVLKRRLQCHQLFIHFDIIT